MPKAPEPALSVSAFLFFRPDRLSGALDEGLDLYHILLLQFAGEIGHAAIAERTFEHDVL